MINSARRQVEEVEDCARGYGYILLDEVQDLSRNRLLLVRSILRKNPGCKLFAVGDDWQSIYRFAGSDLTLIRNFEHVFGLTTRRSFIESTHRFGQPTIRISCNFIQRNPIQSYKRVKGTKKTSTPIYVIYNKQTRQKEGQDAESLQLILRNIVECIGFETIKQKTIQIISRFNQDILRIKSEHFTANPRGDSNSIFDIV
jgi:DNA helicase-4